MTTLDRIEIERALVRLDEILGEAGVCGEICIFGGAAMVLAFDARPSTRDVDAIFEPKTKVADAARRVSEELDLPADWLNDGVKGFVSSTPELTVEDMPVLPNLRILRPTGRYLLAMKCLASRVPGYDTRGDLGDVVRLCRSLGLRSADEIFRIIEDFYPRDLIPARTQFFVEEAIATLAEPSS
jgi:hypothetical protein